ncbi:restriction endonuclease subunit S [Citrobacter braakii]
MAKYKAYPEYKDSGVEWLKSTPAHWSSAPIKYLALATNSLFLDGDWIESKDISDDGVRYITTGNVGEGLYKEQGSGFITENTFSKLNCTEVFEGDILISRLNNPIGRACLVPSLGYKTVTSVDNVIFRTDKYYNRKYLVYLFSSKDYFQHTGNLARGTTMQRISRGLLGNIRIPVPTRSEQASIAAFLDHETAKIDNLIEKQLQLIELLKEKRQAVISYAVTKGLKPDVPMKDSGVEWLGEVPEHWKICRIKQLSKQISKGTTPSTIGGDFVDEGIRFLKAENIGKSKFVNSLPEFYISNDVDKQISRSRLQERDVLVIIAGATTGMASVLQKEILPANTNQAVSFIRTKNSNHADWVYYWLGTDTIQRIIGMGAVQAAQPNLSMEDLGNIPILLPEQDELASICMEIEKQFVQFESLICKAESAIDLMQERRTALISAAVTGKIDVRDWVAPDSQDVEEPEEATA